MILEDVAYESINANSPAEEEDDAGCFSPPPRCLEHNAILEDNRCCGSIGACGVGGEDAASRVCRVPRHRLMAVACALSVAGAALSAVGVCGVSTYDAVVRAVPWSYVDRAHSRVYLGLREAVVVAGGRARGVAWASHDCGEELALADDADDGACARCQAASLASVSFAVLALVTSLPNVRADLGRSTRRGDTNCAKATAIATGVVSTASSLSSLALYDRSCHRAVAHSRAGLGLVCVAVAVGLKPVNVLFHALLRTPREKHRRLLRWRPHGRAESDNGVTVASMTGPALI